MHLMSAFSSITFAREISSTCKRVNGALGASGARSEAVPKSCSHACAQFEVRGGGYSDVLPTQVAVRSSWAVVGGWAHEKGQASGASKRS